MQVGNINLGARDSMTSSVAEHNKQELAKFKKYLNLMPKVVLIYAVDNALVMAMEPALEPFDATKGMHDSSNAAYNWRVSYSGAKKPLVLWNKGHQVVGNKYEQRSLYDIHAAYATQLTREGMEISKVYNKNFSGTGADRKAASLELYNSIDELGIANYTRNANIRGIFSAIVNHANEGATIGYSILKTTMSSGVKGSPNSDGLLATVSQRFGNI